VEGDIAHKAKSREKDQHKDQFGQCDALLKVAKLAIPESVVDGLLVRSLKFAPANVLHLDGLTAELIQSRTLALSHCATL